MSRTSRGRTVLAPDFSTPGRTHLSWLLQLRWAAVVGQLGTILLVRYGLGIPLPMGSLFAVLLFELASNLGMLRWYGRWRAAGAPTGVAWRVQSVVMVLDTLCLGILLGLTGGLSNPFTSFIFVHLVLGAVLLPVRLALVGALVAFGCLLSLFAFSQPLPGAEVGSSLYLVGQLISLVMSATITVGFVGLVTRALARSSKTLQAERENQARAERLEALGTLAAGAAHELATPLSTIAVVAKELVRSLEREGQSPRAVEDLRLVRGEVARCRRILDRMHMESGDRAGETLLELEAQDLVADTLEELPGARRVDSYISDEASLAQLRLPVEAVAMALRNLLSNALDASPAGARVELRVTLERGLLDLAVRDQGPGMDAEAVARAQDPFFTTKEPGEGMGLGLFLSRSVVDRLGGELILESKVGVGTVAHLRVPPRSAAD
ncbi:MAG: two-component system sensor histidine kinase RegB [Planctomycetota bacterium]